MGGGSDESVEVDAFKSPSWVFDYIQTTKILMFEHTRTYIQTHYPPPLASLDSSLLRPIQLQNIRSENSENLRRHLDVHHRRKAPIAFNLKIILTQNF